MDAGRNTREIILVNEIGNYVVQLQYHIYAPLVLLTREDATFNFFNALMMRWCQQDYEGLMLKTMETGLMWMPAEHTRNNISE